MIDYTLSFVINKQHVIRRLITVLYLYYSFSERLCSICVNLLYYYLNFIHGNRKNRSSVNMFDM